MSTAYRNYVQPTVPSTPQHQPIPESGQVPNSAGGFGWAVTPWEQLDRFLTLGSESGTYYVGERTLTEKNASAVLKCIQEDGPRVVARTVEISVGGRAHKNEPALLVLALCAAKGDAHTKSLVRKALPQVARIGTHLLHFVAYADGLRGWGRSLKKGVASWYTDQDPKHLGYQVAKYQSRDAWSHRDVLRLAHPKPRLLPADALLGVEGARERVESTRTILHWIAKGWDAVGEDLHPDPALQTIWAFERAKRATKASEVAALIRDYRLPRECVPTEWLKDKAVWEALAADMPMTALIRNLANLTRHGVLTPLSETTAALVAQLRDHERLRKARVHPVALLAAAKTYAGGASAFGRRANVLAHRGRDRFLGRSETIEERTWTPVPAVVDALTDGFYATWTAVEPTGKATVVGIDVSSSMHGTLVHGIPNLSAAEAAGAMALVTAASEPRAVMMAFNKSAHTIDISPRQRLDDVARRIVASWPNDGTDCAQPILWALKQGVKAEVFLILTDSQTWYGTIHPAEAMRLYRTQTGIPAKLVVVAMSSEETSIADPRDAGILNVVGFDTNVPAIVANFIRGRD